ncbi:HAMP domain-containing sensor histidine kinase [Azospirillum sp. SYSU D00513]|uniref:sensor histidine kinase n=1 Tax=Azospirillum sp. SYSU D00513 TaxID=2812561 RepID=UPI001A971018|nr:HAMP domain-containing sensor histidine kinase [Azospirillum sp. SYSU D00513]
MTLPVQALRALRACNVAFIGGIFLLDAVTSADNVSICFAYAIPIVLGILEGQRAAFWYACAATLLSVVGTFIQPPTNQITAVFYANRVIAIATQWAMALLVHYRLRAEEVLRRGLEEEREKVDRQKRFIAMLSHEVKTPLTTIDGQAYRMGKLASGITPEDVAVRSGKIRDAVRRVNDIIEGVLLSSSVGTGEPAPALGPLDLRLLVADAAAQAREAAGGDAAVTGDLAGLPERFEGDGTLLSQLFGNLVSNALKYSGPGATVRVSGWTEEGHAVVAVADEGIGIDAADIPHLFNPYFRGGNSRGVSGAGIGLYLVDRYVAAHGGTVTVDSTPGAGTTVTVRLPLGRPAGEAP